ncbi:oxidoreductase, pyridine nucleotide-disulfide family protein [Carnobacterium sp. AT7]|uniref:FAD-dependent oxidoreductase n=1 Tax=Carnobacterium sp. AT7 TaxID=333990 RepID=UPI00015F17A7|nr:FAD-dependent oxidoreductase [Carnobacterium sp. AT7]EDP68064.1 oxidoreductase, pyridine nucleotide-disulfide family protein [Carnobacterium sp. AT7]
MKVVIIGASFAGVAAALEVRKKQLSAEIILLEKQPTLGYIPNGLHLYWENRISDLKDAYFITKEQLEKQNIQCCLEAAVEKIDTTHKAVHYMFHGQEATITYDKLIIATGSSQLSQKISGSDGENVLKYKHRHEAEDALAKVDASKSVTIIGAGQVGVEAACLLSKQQKKVTLIESMDFVLFKYFDKDMIQPLQQKMREQGIDLRLNQTVSSIEAEVDQLATIRFGNEMVKSEAVILGVNVRPDLHFLDEHISLHMDQTIAVDRYMRTSAEDVFAIGDCIQLAFGEDDETVYIPLVNNAVRTGIVAASNLIQPKMIFKGSLRTIGTFIFGYYIASTGMTEAESVFTNQKVKTYRQKVRLTSLPSSDVVTIKWVYDETSHILLGAQMISTSDVLEKINTLALAIQTKQTLEDLQQKDYFFHPSFTQMISATNFVSWPEVRDDGNEN